MIETADRKTVLKRSVEAEEKRIEFQIEDVKLTGDRLIVEMLDPIQTGKGGKIIMAGNVQSLSNLKVGLIINCGSGRKYRNSDGKEMIEKIGYKKGQYVVLMPSGQLFTHLGVEYLLLRETEVVGLIDKKNLTHD